MIWGFVRRRGFKGGSSLKGSGIEGAAALGLVLGVWD